MNTTTAIDGIVQRYGDLLFDLCESVLWNPTNAQIAFRSILKTLKKNLSSASYKDHERAWVLRVACQNLRGLSKDHGRLVTASEQIAADSSQNVSNRLKNFDFYFHRLPMDDQMVLLLRDKYGLPYPEIAAALRIPDASLKIRRQQSLRTLEEWLWENYDTDLPVGTAYFCFDWQSRSSDYLDGTLIASQKREADEHLDLCPACSDRYKHYRLILTSIASQPRSALPVPIRKSPFSVALPRLEARGFRGWERIPWYLRIPIEGILVISIILLAISAGPRLRSLYERKIERSMDDYNDAGELIADSPEGAGITAPLVRVSTGDSSSTAETFNSEGDSDTDTDTDANVTAAEAQVWRFNFKTDSPREIRPKIVKVLTDLGVPAATPGIGGIEAPGGIQFDLLVSPDIVPNLKKQLEKLAPKTSEGQTDPTGENFTWYKNKNRSHQPIPSGRTRVVIWLSQV